MGREAIVLALLLVAVVVSAVRLAQRSQRLGAPSGAQQAVVGLVCGAFGAMAAVTPYVDVVPDRAEVPILASVPVVILVGWALHRSRAHRRTPRHAFDPRRAPFRADARAGARARVRRP